MANGNLGKVVISDDTPQTAGHPAVIQRLPVQSGVEYPSGAVVTYDEAGKVFKPSDMQESAPIRYCVIVKPAAKDETYATAIIHGCIDTGLVRKAVFSSADSPVPESWTAISDDDYRKLCLSSMLM